MNVILDAAKTEYWPVPVVGIDKVRLQAAVADVLDEARPSTLGKGDQLVHGALKTSLIEGIIAGRFRHVHATLAKLLGLDTTNVKSPAGEAEHTTSGKPLHDREVEGRKPLAKAASGGGR